MTQRDKDQKFEKRNTDYFCNYLNSISANYKLVNDVEHQVLGDDLELYGKTLSAVVDLKAKSYQMDKIEDIYDAGIGLELSRICKDGIRREGWFIDKKNITDMYIFLLPVEKNFTIQSQYSIWVSKKALLSEVLKEINYEDLCQLSSFSPDNYYDKRVCGKNISKTFYVTKSFEYSNKNGERIMKEEPVNLCIKIKDLIKICKKIIHN